MSGDWFFHGLTFKFKNGPYLGNKKATVDWKLQWESDSNRLNIINSTLGVEGENYNLSGHLTIAKPAYLKLVIDHPGLMLDAGRKVIANNIRSALSKLTIDQPIQVKVVVNGPLISGQPPPTDFFFSTENAKASFDSITLDQTNLSGHFYNCDPGGIVDPHSGCLELDTFSTRLFNIIPIQGNVFVTDSDRS